MRIAVAGVVTLFLAACASGPVNPSFPVTDKQADQAIAQMRADPRPLPRPVVLVGGFLDPEVVPTYHKMFFKSISSDAILIPVSVGFCNSFGECRDKVISAVDAACPSNDPIWTNEVDVVGVSLGGLVARFAAAPSLDPSRPRRLKIARLFSISSPQSGAKIAETAPATEFDRDLRPGSDFLKDIASADATATYKIYPYVLLRDDVINDAYAAPPGMTAFWLANDSWFPSHPAAMVDDRILADIGRRLRDEPAFSHEPAAPLPVEK
jgi:pimeloyl-ACP methyl ester carboxylesterase